MHIENHPKYIKEKLKNLTEDQFGYSAFGLKSTISRSGLDYLKAYKEKFFL